MFFHTTYNFLNRFAAARKFEFFSGEGIGNLNLKESFGTFRVDRSTRRSSGTLDSFHSIRSFGFEYFEDLKGSVSFCEPFRSF